MDLNRLLEQIAETRLRLFAEGYLNANFTYLENFEQEYNLGFFAEEALETYFQRSASLLTRLEQELERVRRNFNVLETLLNQIRKYTMSVGASNIMMKVNGLRDLVDRRRNARSCQNALRELKLERERFKGKMKLYFRMKRMDPPLEIDDNHGCNDETNDEDN